MPKKKKANGRLTVVPDTVDIRQEEEPADAASADSENSIKPPEKEASFLLCVRSRTMVSLSWWQGLPSSQSTSSRPGGSGGAGSTEKSCWRGKKHPHTGFEGGRRPVDGINSSRRQWCQCHSKACSWQSGDNGGGENGGGCQCELASVP